ncbi:MAG: hypothetical protein AABX73_04580 [Nanoarchaeota archaeon]
MLFDKKNKNLKCEACGSKIEKKYSFCPHCGNNFIDFEKEQEEFGVLGRNDFIKSEEKIASSSFGITDKLVGSIFNSLMRNLDKQLQNHFKDMERDIEKAEIKTFPNGIRIKIVGPMTLSQEQDQNSKKSSAIHKKSINENQLQKIISLPKEKAKTSVKRLGNKIIYELEMPGVLSPHDVFLSKLESGYEVKAIGNKKVYVNNIPINLPIKKCSIQDSKLFVEFLSYNS